MRSLARTAVGVGVAVLLVAVPPATAQTPASDSVTGTLNDPFVSVVSVAQIDARSGPSGENPTGTANWHAGGGLGPDWFVTITCLSVSGNTAVAGFSGTVELAFEFAPTAGLFRVVDGGGPGSAQDSFEWAEVMGPVGGAAIPGPTSCSSFPATFPSFNVLALNRFGDLTVVDAAPPLPTSKEQCKNGGWRTFGVFKNQGDCVSFVATGGSNPPAKT